MLCYWLLLRNREPHAERYQEDRVGSMMMWAAVLFHAVHLALLVAITILAWWRIEHYLANYSTIYVVCAGLSALLDVYVLCVLFVLAARFAFFDAPLLELFEFEWSIRVAVTVRSVVIVAWAVGLILSTGLIPCGDNSYTAFSCNPSFDRSLIAEVSCRMSEDQIQHGLFAGLAVHPNYQNECWFVSDSGTSFSPMDHDQYTCQQWFIRGPMNCLCGEPDPYVTPDMKSMNMRHVGQRPEATCNIFPWPWFYALLTLNVLTGVFVPIVETVRGVSRWTIQAVRSVIPLVSTNMFTRHVALPLFVESVHIALFATSFRNTMAGVIIACATGGVSLFRCAHKSYSYHTYINVAYHDRAEGLWEFGEGQPICLTKAPLGKLSLLVTHIIPLLAFSMLETRFVSWWNGRPLWEIVLVGATLLFGFGRFVVTVFTLVIYVWHKWRHRGHRIDGGGNVYVVSARHDKKHHVSRTKNIAHVVRPAGTKIQQHRVAPREVRLDISAPDHQFSMPKC